LRTPETGNTLRWLLTTIVVAGGCAAVAVVLLIRSGADEPVSLPQDPMPGRLLVGFQDDATFRWAADRAEMLDEAQAGHASLIRTTVVWATAAPERPANPANAFDPAYALDEVDDLARNAQQRGIELLITIWGTPPWANGGQARNYAPADAGDLEAFAEAIADRYSGRHPGYPAVRLFSVWNEPNLEQFLAPQFDDEGRSVGPQLYAPLARAVYEGVKRANPEALVAIGETSPRGHDVPSRGRAQGSHSPPRFARLLSEERPRVRFDAWAQHPYPPRADVAPMQPVRWPRVGLANLERFGQSLDEWFGRDDTPLWITEYGHETTPDEPLGVAPQRQAEFVEDALGLAAQSTRVRTFVWFIVRDRAGNPWQSGLIAADGFSKPGLARFGEVASSLDGRNPVLPDDAALARVPALELAFHSPVGSPIEVSVEEGGEVSVPLGRDGWLEVPLEETSRPVVDVRATDLHGNSVVRAVRLAPETLEVK
jgi:hypothetical protein